jgi:CRP-like cAMP-binding protein
MFVLLSGRVGAFKRNARGDLELLGEPESGETIGEMAFLSNERRLATIIALSNTELVCVGRHLFEELVSRSPNLMRFMAGVVTMRLRRAEQARSRVAGLPHDDSSLATEHPAVGDSVDRKLAATFCADVFGYSRLMGDDEEATLRTLSAYRRIIDRLIKGHHGRFVNSAGDSLLAEFSSVVEAVNCAVEVQNALSAENSANGVPHRH